MLNLLRDRRLSILWTVVRIWLGWQWLQAGLHKLADPKWMETGVALKGYWTKAVGTPGLIHYSWYKAFLSGLLNSGSHTWFAKLVAVGEFLTGLALILGVLTVFSLVVAAFMNFNYMLAGTTSTNPVLYTLAIILLLAGSAAYYYGLDRVILHYLRRDRKDALSKPVPAQK
ncbi:MAG: thiosulfate dehydrogenase (quinone) large subunit [Moorella sp. (in: firmicutes)]|uniref:DoxX n=1 Tax=Neomoorella thermoacetica TaxID=1525 RepID=A0A1J5NJT8_NEOTH|nr:thiosulfate dehydrogenase (quinone) large subunit [Moorella sp. (in: firmicutes)]OIQ59345.1 DoxX [Moorella thermoacetica]